MTIRSALQRLGGGQPVDTRDSRHLRRVDQARRAAVGLFLIVWATALPVAVLYPDAPLAALLGLAGTTIGGLLGHAAHTAHSSARRHHPPPVQRVSMPSMDERPTDSVR